jgi:hypothetical protein
MKRKLLKLAGLSFFLIIASCDEPVTVVTNYVHSDGTVTRKIEMSNKKNNFIPTSVQVPFDSTWSVKDSISIGAKNDTTWFKTAIKFYENVDQINKEYLAKVGVNSKTISNASFIRKFRWFNTVYRFSEKIDKSLFYGYNIDKFLAKEEMDYFYLPENISSEKLAGPDSLKYKKLSKSTEENGERYFWTSAVSEWIEEFSKLTAGRTGQEISKERLKLMEKEIVDSLIRKEPKSDTIVISRFLGHDNYKKFRAESDTAYAILSRRIERNISFVGYSVKFVMPGKVTASDGFVLKNGEVMWPVRSEFFYSQPFEMWAESKQPNIWAWIVSGLFLLFVMTGIIRLNKKG